jgi:hypothetical protein
MVGEAQRLSDAFVSLLPVKPMRREEAVDRIAAWKGVLPMPIIVAIGTADYLIRGNAKSLSAAVAVGIPVVAIVFHRRDKRGKSRQEGDEKWDQLSGPEPQPIG